MTLSIALMAPINWCSKNAHSKESFIVAAAYRLLTITRYAVSQKLSQAGSLAALSVQRCVGRHADRFRDLRHDGAC